MRGILEVSEVKETCAFLLELEMRIFEYLRFPKITFRNMSFVSLEKHDREFMEELLLDLYSNFGRTFTFHPLWKVIRYYEHIYKSHQRLNQRKQDEGFYIQAIRQAFIYIYEARMKVGDDNTREDYLRHFL